MIKKIPLLHLGAFETFLCSQNMLTCHHRFIGYNVGIYTISICSNCVCFIFHCQINMIEQGELDAAFIPRDIKAVFVFT